MKYQLDLLENFNTASNLDELWQKLHSYLANFGVTSIFYGIMHSRKLANEITNKAAMYYRTSHPSGMADYYEGKEFHYINQGLPINHSLQDSRPFILHDEREWKCASPLQLKIRKINHEWGIKVGVSLPVRFHDIYGTGGIGLAFASVSPKEFDKIWLSHQQEITAAANMFDEFSRMEHMYDIYPLSDREKEALNWLSGGNTIKQIAFKMGTKPSTVDKQIRSARKKLKATNNEQATIKAFTFGIVSP